MQVKPQPPKGYWRQQRAGASEAVKPSMLGRIRRGARAALHGVSVAVKEHSGLITGILTVLAAGLGLATAVTSQRANNAINERDSLADSQSSLESRIEDLESQNEQLAADLEEARVDLDDRGNNDVAPTNNESSENDHGGWVNLSSVEYVYGSWDIRGSVTINHAEYANAYALTDRSPVEYNLGREYSRLTGSVGLTDDSTYVGSGSLTILVDGQPSFSSDVSPGPLVPIDIDLSDARRLEFSADVSDEITIALVDVKLERRL